MLPFWPLSCVYALFLVPIGLLRLLLPSAAGLATALATVCAGGILFWGTLELWLDFRRTRRESVPDPHHPVTPGTQLNASDRAPLSPAPRSSAAS